MTQVLYKVGDDYFKAYQDALEAANGNVYNLKTLYIENVNRKVSDESPTIEELLRIYEDNQKRI